MGGKRPDQYRIDPADSGATDYKNLPQTGRGNSSLDDTVEIDRQKHARSEADARQSPIPGDRPAPSRDANRPLRDRQSARSEAHDERPNEPGDAEAPDDEENSGA